MEASLDIAWRVGRDLTCDDSVRFSTGPGGDIMVGKVVGLEMTAENGRRRIRLTVGIAIGDGKAAVPPDDGEDYVKVGDVWVMVTGPSPVVPVNAYALGSMQPDVFEFDRMSAYQLTQLWSAADPEAALASIPTTLSIRMPTLREEDLLPRRLRATCTPVPVPMGINLGGVST